MGVWGWPNAYICLHGGWVGLARCLRNQKNHKKSLKKVSMLRERLDEFINFVSIIFQCSKQTCYFWLNLFFIKTNSHIKRKWHLAFFLWSDLRYYVVSEEVSKQLWISDRYFSSAYYRLFIFTINLFSKVACCVFRTVSSSNTSAFKQI